MGTPRHTTSTAEAAVADAVSPKSGGALAYGQYCAACHGEKGEGNALIKAPPIAGQYDWYLLDQLGKFAAGKRGLEGDEQGTVMRGIAASISPSEFAGIAAFAASLPSPPPPPEWDKGSAASGRGYFEVCSACHGSTGAGNAELKAPRIAGLPGWYIKGEIAKFQSGLRGGPTDSETGQQMKPLAEMLTSESSADDVVSYLTSLH